MANPNMARRVIYGRGGSPKRGRSDVNRWEGLQQPRGGVQRGPYRTSGVRGGAGSREQMLENFKGDWSGGWGSAPSDWELNNLSDADFARRWGVSRDFYLSNIAPTLGGASATGAVTGAGIGSIFGPIGTLVGGAGGAVVDYFSNTGRKPSNFGTRQASMLPYQTQTGPASGKEFEQMQRDLWEQSKEFTRQDSQRAENWQRRSVTRQTGQKNVQRIAQEAERRLAQRRMYEQTMMRRNEWRTELLRRQQEMLEGVTREQKRFGERQRTLRENLRRQIAPTIAQGQSALEKIRADKGALIDEIRSAPSTVEQQANQNYAKQLQNALALASAQGTNVSSNLGAITDMAQNQQANIMGQTSIARSQEYMNRLQAQAGLLGGQADITGNIARLGLQGAEMGRTLALDEYGQDRDSMMNLLRLRLQQTDQLSRENALTQELGLKTAQMDETSLLNAYRTMLSAEQSAMQRETMEFGQSQARTMMQREGLKTQLGLLQQMQQGEWQRFMQQQILRQNQFTDPQALRNRGMLAYGLQVGVPAVAKMFGWGGGSGAGANAGAGGSNVGWSMPRAGAGSNVFGVQTPNLMAGVPQQNNWMNTAQLMSTQNQVPQPMFSSTNWQSPQFAKPQNFLGQNLGQNQWSSW